MSSCNYGYFLIRPLPQALRFSRRGQRQARTERQYCRSVRDHGKKVFACFLPPAFLCAQIYFERETSEYEATPELSPFLTLSKVNVASAIN